VAGTLTHLDLEVSCADAWLTDGGVWYEVGLAMGKLRRLRGLALDLGRDGRAYYNVGEGMAAGGGDRPLPSLWRVSVISNVKTHADLLASLLLPRVEMFKSYHLCTRAAVLIACAMRQKGYRRTWGVEGPPEVEEIARAIAPRCRLVGPRFNARFYYFWGME
jgi:hypothetical protein